MTTAPTPAVADDLRVLLLGEALEARFAARLLADLGAEVAHAATAPDSDPFASWLALGVARLDVDPAQLDDPERRELLAGYDVVIAGLRPEERARTGLSAAGIRALAPDAIVATVTPHGETGSLAHHPGTDLTAAAESALCTVLGEPGQTPLRLPFDQTSMQGGFHAVAAILTALHRRDSSGGGATVDISSAHVMTYLTGGMALVTAKRGVTWRRRGRFQNGTIYPTGFFEASDGYVCIASQTPKQWLKILELLGDPAWSQSDEARDAVALGNDPAPVDEHFRAWMRTQSRDDLAAFAFRGDITMGPSFTATELLADPHLATRDFWQDLSGTPTVRVPRIGPRLTRSPLVASPEPRTARRPAVTPGDGPTDPSLPLAGVRILDFTWNWAGPMATQMLADFGAEVIRVETSKRQDLMRLLKPTSWFFCHNNRNKRSITVDITKPEGVALVHDLVGHCDAVVDNFAPGVMARRGLDHATLTTVKPDIITVSMTMAGLSGPLRDMRGFASIGTAFAGLEHRVGYEGGEATGLMSFGLGDVTLAVNASIGLLAALRHHRRTGEGQQVEVSMVECVLAGLAAATVDAQLGADDRGPEGNRDRSLAPHGVYAADGDDAWVAVAVRDTRDWTALCDVLSRPDLAEDPALATVSGRRADARVTKALEEWAITRTPGAASDELRTAGIPAAPVRQLKERDASDWFTQRRAGLHHEGGIFDPCEIYSTPWLIEDAPVDLRRPTPALGEANDDVFRGLMGMSQHDLNDLVERGIVA